MRSPSAPYASRKDSNSSSVPASVRSPLTTTTSGSRPRISSITAPFITSGYGGSPGSARRIGPSSSSPRSPIRPHSTSPKCTSLAVAIVASRRPAGRSSFVNDGGSHSLRSVPSTTSSYSVPASSPVTRALWYGPRVVTSASPTRVVTGSSPSVRNVTTASSGPTVMSSASCTTAIAPLASGPGATVDPARQAPGPAEQTGAPGGQPRRAYPGIEVLRVPACDRGCRPRRRVRALVPYDLDGGGDRRQLLRGGVRGDDTEDGPVGHAQWLQRPVARLG